MQCAPKNPWRPLRGPWRTDGLPHIAEPPKLGGCPHTCEILLTDKEEWGETGAACGYMCVGQSDHEGLHACSYHIGVPAAASDSRQTRARARPPHGRRSRHPSSPSHSADRSRTLLIRPRRSCFTTRATKLTSILLAVRETRSREI
eukprot:1617557-Pyramimonas_sp.AAC.1